MGSLGRLAVGVLLGVALAPWIAISPGAAVALAGLACLLGTTRAWRCPTAVLAGIAIGLLAVARLPPGPHLAGPVALRGVVVGAPSGRTATLSLSAVARPDEGWRPASGRVQVWLDPPPGRGETVVVRGTAGSVRRALAGAPDPVRTATRARVSTEVRGRAWATLAPRAARRDPFAAARHRGLLRALVLGDRSDVDPEDWRRLRRTGTAHLLAISGFHVGLVALCVAMAARTALRVAALLRPSGWGEAPAWVLGALAGVGYTVLVGAPASAWRAAGLAVLVAGARLSGRAAEPLRLLAVVAAAQVLVDPAVIGTAGFQLSHGAVLGLILVTPRILLWLPPDLPRPLALVGRGVAVTLGAMAGTLPAAAWWFQEVAPAAPIANLLAGPWVAWGVAPLAAGALVLPEPLAAASLWGADGLADALLRVLGVLETTPWTPAVGPVGAAALFLALWLPRNRWRVVALFVVLAVRPPPAPGVTVLPVRGQAVFLSGGDGERWLLDGGPPSQQVLRWLRRAGVRRLDGVQCTRPTVTHCGGLVPVIEGLDVAQVRVPQGARLLALRAAARRRGTPVIEVPAGVYPASWAARRRRARSWTTRAYSLLWL